LPFLLKIAVESSLELFCSLRPERDHWNFERGGIYLEKGDKTLYHWDSIYNIAFI